MTYSSGAFHWALQSAGLPVLRNWLEAKAYHDKVKPIRGSDPEVRPLGSNRRYTQCAIEQDPVTGNIKCNLWGNTCVEFTKDDLVKIRHTGWVGPTTCNFIDRIIPSSYGTVYIDKGKMIFVDRDAGIRDNAISDKYIVGSSDWLVLKLNNTNGMAHSQARIQAISGEPLTNWHMDVKTWNRIRAREFAKFQPFLEYYKVLRTMRPVQGQPEGFAFMLDALGIPSDTPVERISSYIPEPESVNAKYHLVNHPNYFLMQLFSRGFSLRMSDVHRHGDGTWGSVRKLPEAANLFFDSESEQFGHNHNRLYEMVCSDDPVEWVKAHTVLSLSCKNVYLEMQPMEEIIGLLEAIVKTRFAGEIFKKVELPAGQISLKRNNNFVYVNAHIAYTQGSSWNKST